MRLRDAALGLRIAAAIPEVWLRTRLLPLPRALAGLTPSRAHSAQRTAHSKEDASRLAEGPAASSAVRCALCAVRSQSEATRIIRLTDLVLERRVALLRPSCMLRSLVLYRFLREAGIPVQVNFGVARDGDSLKGHSWLTLNGIPYAEPVDPTLRFRVVYCYPEDRRQTPDARRQ